MTFVLADRHANRMERKSEMDNFGVVSLVAFSAMLAFNQVVVKVTNEGIQPVFSAGLRSVGAIVVLLIILRVMRRGLTFTRASRPWLFALGCAFSLEFVLLFQALDMTTVSRASVMFYSMPVWMAFGAHFLLPGERLTPVRMVGLLLAIIGVAWAIFERPDSGTASAAGDFLALGGAVGWASIGLIARGTAAREATPETQLMVQLAMSAIVLLALSPAFGPLLRDVTTMTYVGMTFQIVVVASGGFFFWMWLLTIYPASSVASFSFLAPVFGVFFGWLLLDEVVGPAMFGSLALVAIGLVLINRR